MLQYNPSISGSLNITGSLIISNGMIGTVNGVDVQIFSSSINQVITGIQAATGSQEGRLGSIESFTSSTSARLNSIETTSASVDTLNSTQNNRLNSLEEKTGSLATTGSNTFYGQQVFSGSLYVQNDLVVQGSSSLQNITASAVSIGTNIVNLNTANPAVRYGGISVQDSGSASGVTGSMLWDSTCNRWVYANPSGVGYSGGIIMSGPRAATLGGEVTLTCNYVAKSGGGDHLYDSCIWEMSGSMGINTASPAVSLHVDASGGGIIRATRLGSGAGYIQLEADGTNGTLTSSNGLLVNTGGNQRVNITSTGIACFSCQVCTPYISVGDGTQSNADDAPLTIKRGLNGFAGLDFKSLRTEGNIGGTRYYNCAGTLQSQLLVEVDGSYNFYNATSNNRLKITNTGIACFSCQICTAGIVSSGNLQINGTSSGKIVAFTNYSNSNVGLALYNTAGTEVIYLNGNSGGIGATHFSGTCLTLNGFASGNGFKMDYGSASGQITAMNLIANGTTNGFIGIQMVDGSNGDLWFGSSANRSMTVYRTGNHGFNVNTPCTKVHVNGGYGARYGNNGCFFGGGIAGGGFPYGDEYGNGASYTYQTCYTTATNTSLFGGYAAGYFKGGDGEAYGGGGAGIVAIGGNGGNAESVNSGGGAGLFARGGKNGTGSVHSYAAWFDGGDVIIRCGNVGIGSKCTPNAPLDVTSASSSSSGIQQWSYNTGPQSYRLQLNTMVCSGLVRYSFDMLNAGASYNCVLTLDRGTVGIGTGFTNGYAVRISSNSSNTPSNSAKIMQIGNDSSGGISGYIYLGSSAGIDWLMGKDTSGAGDYRFNLSLYTGEQRMTLYTNGNYSFAGSNVSDIRLKCNINTLSINASDRISQLVPKCYNMDGIMRYGFIAQDVRNVLSDLITGEEKEKEYLGLDYNGLLTVAVKAIQEQQCTIDILKSCIGIS